MKACFFNHIAQSNAQMDAHNFSTMLFQNQLRGSLIEKIRTGNPVADAVFGGWSVGSIVTLTTGTPATPGVQGNPANVGGGDRPDVVAGQDWKKNNPTPEEWWNTAALAVPEALTYGNAGKGILRIPGTSMWDFSAYKTFRFSEKYSAQFRFEAFNFTNTPNFGTPNTTVGNRNFGRITGADNPRNLQLGLKFIF